MPEDFVSKPLIDHIFSLLKCSAMRTAAVACCPYSNNTTHFPTGFSTNIVEKQMRGLI